MSGGSIIKRPRKDGSPSWLIKYDAGIDPATGKRRQRYKTVRGTKRIAQAELRRLLARVDDGTDLAPTKITVAEWLRRWLADYAPMTTESIATVERYEALVEQHIIPIIGALPLRQLRTAQIQGLYADRLTDGRLRGDGGLSKRTVHHLHRLLSNAMSTAVTEGLIASNPCSTAKSPKPDTPDIVFLDDDQTAALGCS